MGTSIYPIYDAVKGDTTEQEICDVFMQVFGEYVDPGGFKAHGIGRTANGVKGIVQLT